VYQNFGDGFAAEEEVFRFYLVDFHEFGDLVSRDVEKESKHSNRPARFLPEQYGGCEKPDAPS
jgi:hypothetical protein